VALPSRPRYDHRVGRVALLAAFAVLSQSGCSAVVASFASHNSHGTSCMDEPAFPAIDLIGGSLGALALVYTGTAEESPGWLAIPGVFMLSGLIASATVYSCRHPDPTSGGIAQPATPTDYQPPSDNAEQRTPEESDTRDATPEERGQARYTPPPSVDRDVPAPTPKGSAPITCRINPLTACPTGTSCVLTEGESGTCRPDMEKAKPKTTLPP
jgi:hypothetical protein